jgi:hypothetical protein
MRIRPFLPFVFFSISSLSLAHAEWSQMPGPTGALVTVLSRSGSVLLAGTHSKGVYRTTDGGASWRAANSGIENTEVHDLIFTGSHWLASVSNHCGVLSIYQSTDDGTHWTDTNFNNLATSFALKGSVVYATVLDFDSSIYRSTNGGLDWVQLPSPINEANKIFISGNTILVAEHNFIWRSTDDGGNWDPVEQFALSGIRSFAQSGTRFLAAGICCLYSSTNNGASWQFQNFPGGVLSLSASGTTVYLGGGSKVSKSTNSGVNWIDVSTGLGKGDIQALQFDGTNVFAGTPNDTAAIYLTSNGGTSWSPAAVGLPVAPTTRTLAAAGNAIFLGTQGDGIYRSTDNGISWFKKGLNNPDLANQLVLSFCVKNGNIFAGGSNGLFRSTDNGETFQTTVNGFPAGTIFIPSLTVSGGNIVAAASIVNGSSSTVGIFHSSDDGASWHQSIFPATTVYVSSVASDGSSRVYAGSYGESFSTTGLFTSTNNGVSWTSMTFSLNADIERIAVKGSNVLTSNLFFAFYSTDGGNNFFGSGFPDGGIDTYTLKNNLIFGGQKGVHLSTDQGATWTPAQDGFPACPKPIVEASCANDAYLFAGGTDSGVWRIPLSDFGVTGVIADTQARPRGNFLLQNVPNPANPITAIEFSVARPEHVELKIFDVQGREITTLLSEDVQAGPHKLTWDSSAVASGVYYYTLRAEDFERTRQLVVLK